LPVQAWGESTRKADKLFLHVFDWPHDGKLVVGGLKSPVKRAYLLADNLRKPLKATRLNGSDVVLDVPRTQPDLADSVVVVESQREIGVNPVRLLATNGQTNTLRTFDGELNGKGLRYGDGKATRAYVLDWNDPAQWIGWKVRVNEPVDFEVGLKYTTASMDNRGSYIVTIGDQEIKGTVQPTRNENESTTVSLGRVRLAPGEYDVAVKPADIKGGELMRLFNVSLTPVETKRSE
jgi:hypothetical protein